MPLIGDKIAFREGKSSLTYCHRPWWFYDFTNLIFPIWCYHVYAGISVHLNQSPQSVMKSYNCNKFSLRIQLSFLRCFKCLFRVSWTPKQFLNFSSQWKFRKQNKAIVKTFSFPIICCIALYWVIVLTHEINFHQINTIVNKTMYAVSYCESVLVVFP